MAPEALIPSKVAVSAVKGGEIGAYSGAAGITIDELNRVAEHAKKLAPPIKPITIDGKEYYAFITNGSEFNHYYLNY